MPDAASDAAAAAPDETPDASAPPPVAPPPGPSSAPSSSAAAKPDKPSAPKGPFAEPATLHSAFVHVHADYPGAVLELRSFIDDSDWSAACPAPCDRLLRVEGNEARVRADGMSPSNVFRIEPGRGTANLKVVGGSARSRTIGTVGLGAGIPLALGGMALWGYGKLEDKAGLKTAGLITMGVAAVMVVGALPFLSSGSTRVKDGKGKVIASGFAPPSF